MPKCKKCGREYERQDCEKCIRIARIIETKWIEQFCRKTFTPRINQIIFNEITIPEPIKNYQPMFYFGPVGSGKTIQACKGLLNWAIESKIQNTYRDADFMFVKMTDIIYDIRSAFADNELSEINILSKYANVKYLVIDDFGAAKDSEWLLQMLDTLVDKRYENLMETTITSNYSLPTLTKKLGSSRITNRIESMCLQEKREA